MNDVNNFKTLDNRFYEMALEVFILLDQNVQIVNTVNTEI
jgi:hypothetical protein